MAAPDEREFKTFAEGEVRDMILNSFRNDLRTLTNPQTGVAFTEDEIQRATQPGSRFYIEADAIDKFSQAMQARALWLSDQIDPRRAATSMLEDFHGRLWLGENSRLDSTGGSGDVLAGGTPGTIFVGSPTIGDPNAVVGTDPNGLRFQVLETEAVEPDGTVSLTLKGIDTGFETNLSVGTIIKWADNVPLGAAPEATVEETVGEPGVGFKGGFDVENNVEYADRIEERIRERPASGNAAHVQVWAQEANAAVERAFVYPCALNAGSVVVAITEKRNQNIEAGPLARVPSAGVLSDVTSYLTPPNSPVFPQRAYVLVVSVQSQSSDIVMRITMQQGAGGGWADVTPWPAPDPGLGETIEDVQISAVNSQTEFEITTNLPLPGGATTLSGTNVPKMMVWNQDKSRFERLFPASVTASAGTVTVTLLQAPEKTLAVGDRISPYTDRLGVIAEAMEAYFDSLGPGQLVEDDDLRAARAARQPFPSVAYPILAGQALVSEVVDALGGVASNATLPTISRTEPDVPGEIADGPNYITLGQVNIFPL